MLMSDLVIELSQRAQTLRPEERARLAELLLDSIHQSADQTVEDAWDEELQKRIDEVDRGAAKLISAEEVFVRVRRAIQ
jgi:putative addiction module component (TIGR02574 family)